MSRTLDFVRACRAAVRLKLVAAPLVCFALAGCSTGAMPSLSESEIAFLQATPTWDLDKDGVVTCDEWKRYVSGIARDADANGDGVISRDEFKRMASEDKLFEIAGFSYFDANGDGNLTMAELTEKPNPSFKYLDKDHDCRLTQDERPAIFSGRGGSPKMPDTTGKSGRGR